MNSKILLHEARVNEALDDIGAANGIIRSFELLAEYQEYPHLLYEIAESLGRAKRMKRRAQARYNRLVSEDRRIET